MSQQEGMESLKVAPSPNLVGLLEGFHNQWNWKPSRGPQVLVEFDSLLASNSDRSHPPRQPNQSYYLILDKTLKWVHKIWSLASQLRAELTHDSGVSIVDQLAASWVGTNEASSAGKAWKHWRFWGFFLREPIVKHLLTHKNALHPVWALGILIVAVSSFLKKLSPPPQVWIGLRKYKLELRSH